VTVNCRREVGPLIGMLLDSTVALGYTVIQAETGAFACRAIRGSSTPSNHSWGLAIDINWNHNGFGTDSPHDIPGQVVAVWKNYGFRWGGDYSGRKDWMHFEYMGTPGSAQADIARFRQDHTSTHWKVMPTFNPPLQLEPVVDAQPNQGPGFYHLAVSGAVYAWCGAPVVRGCNGQSWWGDRSAAKLEVTGAGKLRVTATSGETYNLPL